MLIDTHCHLYAEQFDGDRNEMVQRAFDNGVEKLLLPNIDLESIDGMHELVSKYPSKCYPMMGLHPCSVGADFEVVLAQMKQQLDERNDYIAVGEIGLDYYWDKTFIEAQKTALRMQIQWAKDKGLPIVLHCRDSFNDVFDIVSEMNDETLSGVFHCFTGSLADAKRVISLGNFYMGLGGVLTFKNSGLDKVVKEIPLEHLILETDAPYLTPTPYRGKRNESAYTKLVADKLWEVKDVEWSEMAAVTTANAHQLFNL